MNANYALLCYYAASSGNFVPTFRDILPLCGVVETMTDENIMIIYYLFGIWGAECHDILHAGRRFLTVNFFCPRSALCGLSYTYLQV